MKRSVAEELVEILKKKKTDVVSLSDLKDELPDALMEQLGLTKKTKIGNIEKILLSVHISHS